LRNHSFSYQRWNSDQFVFDDPAAGPAVALADAEVLAEELALELALALALILALLLALALALVLALGLELRLADGDWDADAETLVPGGDVNIHPEPAPLLLTE
jgi:hypothetical protein